ncbi:hypothetical protein C8F04DRAFT_1404027 [Mycena alexandri]|uniref:Uncharacterized protein n=1 Tax=Mycena alexandri TaxID=1745969 RepID=A0AAD6S4S2_9AGAR|nr:hypothetical protein C8F04DRAFT_1404027 [Mycena alexandri]
MPRGAFRLAKFRNVRYRPLKPSTATSLALACSAPSTPHSLTTRHQAATNRLSPITEPPLTASSSLTSLNSTLPNNPSPPVSPAPSPVASPATSPVASPKMPPSFALPPSHTPFTRHISDSDSSSDSILPPSVCTHFANMSTTYATVEEQGSKAPVVTAGDLTQKTLREFEISFENYAARKSLSDKEQASHAVMIRAKSALLFLFWNNPDASGLFPTVDRITRDRCIG